MPKLNHLSIEVHADAQATWHSFNCYASGREALLPSLHFYVSTPPLYHTLEVSSVYLQRRQRVEMLE